MSRHPFADDALGYAAAGCRVFPLAARTKVPVIPGPGGVLDATTDARQVEAWVRRYPAGNIGYAIEPGSFVLDEDVQHGGHHTLAELERQHGPLPETLTCRTGNGGRHFYFVGEADRGKAGVGLDVKRAGGYTVLPPSVHPTGNVYTWVDPGAPIMAAPEWLLGLLRRPEHDEPPPGNVPSTEHSGDRPGDRWNARGDLGAVLRRNRWQFRGVAGHNQRWVRPAKDPRDGISATFDTGRRVFYVFTSSVPEFEPDQGYSPFEVLVRLEYGGSHSAAARALRGVMA